MRSASRKLACVRLVAQRLCERGLEIELHWPPALRLGRVPGLAGVMELHDCSHAHFVRAVLANVCEAF